jgi:hypothetical protein
LDQKEPRKKLIGVEPALQKKVYLHLREVYAQTATTRPPRTVSIRMPADLYERIETVMAEYNERSMSRFILSVLSGALGRER